jgi:secondary thiamine-phosphate synthase enzyme
MQIMWEQVVVTTVQNNLVELDPKLHPFVAADDHFFMQDITAGLQSLVTKHGLKQGQLVAQTLHTTTALSINELDEPMLAADIQRALAKLAPGDHDYLHHSKLRTRHLDANGNPDTNAAGHIKSLLLGNASVILLFREGKLCIGHYQRVGFFDFDGPKTRKITVQLLGE